MKTFTFSQGEYESLYNAKCKLHHAIRKLDKVLNEDALIGVKSALSQLEIGLARIDAIEDANTDKLQQQYFAEKIERGFNHSWAIFSVENFSDVPFPTATWVKYGDYMTPISANSTWHDLWTAAEQVITKSQSQKHHVFIEGFFQGDGDTTSEYVLLLTTGT